MAYFYFHGISLFLLYYFTISCVISDSVLVEPWLGNNSPGT